MLLDLFPPRSFSSSRSRRKRQEGEATPPRECDGATNERTLPKSVRLDDFQNSSQKTVLRPRLLHDEEIGSSGTVRFFSKKESLGSLSLKEFFSVMMAIIRAHKYWPLLSTLPNGCDNHCFIAKSGNVTLRIEKKGGFLSRNEPLATIKLGSDQLIEMPFDGSSQQKIKILVEQISEINSAVKAKFDRLQVDVAA